MREAILVASGDLRETANRLGWPAQEILEGHVARRLRPTRSDDPAGTSRRCVARPRLHLESADGDGRVRRDRPRRAARRGRGRLAVQPPRAARPASAPRPDPDRRELGRDLARARRHAQHQRVADQDGSRLQHDLGRGPDRPVRRRGDHRVDRSRAGDPRHEPRARPGPGRRCQPRRRRWDADSPTTWRTGWPSWVSSTKAAWGCTTRSSTTSTSTRWGSTRSDSASPRSSPRCAWCPNAKPATATTGCVGAG